VSEPTAAGATSQIAAWLASVDVQTIPDEVVGHARRLLLDHLAAVVIGSTTDVSKAIRAFATEAYSGDQATVVCGGRLSAPGAALVNGSAAHGFETDDGYTPGSVHPSAVVWPAVLAAAERHGIGFARALVAAAAGVELTCRIAEAGHPSTWRNGFHNTPIAGVFGAAAGVAVLLGEADGTVAQALGIAGSHAGGLFAFLGQGAEVKRLHAGKAARDGLISVDLARRGVTGPTDVLEAEKGYFSAFARNDWKQAALLGELGKRWAMLDTYLKPYPCCRHLHGPIDAVLALAERNNLSIGDVRGVTVETYEVAAHHRRRDIANVLDAQMSIPYAIAIALRDREVGLTQFGRSARSDARVRSLLERVDVVASDELTRSYPAKRPARVSIECEDGRRVAAVIGQPLGEPSNPLSDDALARKARSLCTPVIGDERTEALISGVLTGEDLDGVLAGLCEDGGHRGGSPFAEGY